MIILTRAEIEKLVDFSISAQLVENAYRATSRGLVNLPPVGHITFPGGGDCHIKYGHIQGDPHFVIKVATGFPRNDARGIPNGNGMVLVLSAETGAVKAMLHDEMTLTDIRTGLGGAIASRALARKDATRALVIGTGPQARRQIEAHSALMPALSFKVWGRDAQKLSNLVANMRENFDVTPVGDLAKAVKETDILITATGSESPIVMSDWVEPGTHITAIGADAPGKQELETDLIRRADIVVVDLASQCLDHGEVSHAAKAGLIDTDSIVELGAVLDANAPLRTHDAQITIADLTGIAAQDIAMANAVLAALDLK